MDQKQTPSPELLSHVPGRVRVHLPHWSRASGGEVESYFAGIEGVRAASANCLTGNVLIHFNPRSLSLDRLLQLLATLPARFLTPGLAEVNHALLPFPGSDAAPDPSRSPARNAVMRAVVRGTLGHAAVDLLFYGATASASALGWGWVGSLGVAHLVLDVFVWSAALLPLAEEFRRPNKHWIMSRS